VIILDTNVLSALRRTVPDGAVVGWLDRQPAESTWITSVTLYEARLGLATRNARHFADLRINVVDPWRAPGR
jgi:predicted nucleic acid-binding protein